MGRIGTLNAMGWPVDNPENDYYVSGSEGAGLLAAHFKPHPTENRTSICFLIRKRREFFSDLSRGSNYAVDLYKY